MRKIVILFVAVALVAALSAYVTRALVDRNSCCVPQRSTYEVLNDQLGLTAAQRTDVAKLEKDFAAKEAALKADLNAANQDLAKTIAAENAYSPKVAAAVEHVHMCMGELQKASIAHLYELSGRLDPKQREKLMQSVALALGKCD